MTTSKKSTTKPKKSSTTPSRRTPSTAKRTYVRRKPLVSETAGNFTPQRESQRVDGSTGSHIDAQFRRYKMSLKYNSQHLIIVALLVGIVVYALTSLAHAVWR